MLSSYKKRKEPSIIFQNNPKKRKGRTEENSDSEDDKPEPGDLAKLLPLLHDKNDDYVYKMDNHIYFTGPVNKLSINKLAKLVHRANREYQITKTSLAGIGCIDIGKVEAKPIYLHINSCGGDLFEGFRGMDIIKTSAIPVYTIIEGQALSAGSMMFLAGKQRYMTEKSYMLIHQLSVSNVEGTFENMTDEFVNNTHLMDTIVDIYFEASDGVMKKKQIKEILKHDMYWDFKTCKKHNLVKDIYKGES